VQGRQEAMHNLTLFQQSLLQAHLPEWELGLEHA
jgi:hypothetical protein